MVDIDPLTGAPVVKPFAASDDASKTAKGTDDTTANQGKQQTTEVEYPNTVEALEKKVEDLKIKVTVATEAAHAAHTALMDAQRELAFAKAH